MKYLILILPLLVGCAAEHTETINSNTKQSVATCKFACEQSGMFFHQVLTDQNGYFLRCACRERR